jgi:plastocyanin
MKLAFSMVVTVLFSAVSGLGAVHESYQQQQPNTTTITDQTYSDYYLNPNAYKGIGMDITGKISQISSPGIISTLEMHQGGNTDRNLTVIYTSSISLEAIEDDCVRVIGAAAEPATIVADSIEKIDCSNLNNQASEFATTEETQGEGITGKSSVLTILNGASVQGNPAYEPSQPTVKVGDTIAVENKDIAPHTVTNGKDATDPNMGKLFDTSIINAGDSGEILTADLLPGEYPYFCSVHPYMKGTLRIQSTVSPSSEDLTGQNPLENARTEEETSTTAISNGQKNQTDIIPTNRTDLLSPLLDDAMKYLQNGDNEGALVYMGLLRQQLLLQDSNSSIPRLAGLLVDDANKDLQSGDSTSASLHLNLAKEQMTNYSNSADILTQNSTSNRSVVQNEVADNMTGLMNQTVPVNQIAEIPMTGNLSGEQDQNNSSLEELDETLRAIFGQ